MAMEMEGDGFFIRMAQPCDSGAVEATFRSALPRLRAAFGFLDFSSLIENSLYPLVGLSPDDEVIAFAAFNDAPSVPGGVFGKRATDARAWAVKEASSHGFSVLFEGHLLNTTLLGMDEKKDQVWHSSIVSQPWQWDSGQQKKRTANMAAGSRERNLLSVMYGRAMWHLYCHVAVSWNLQKQQAQNSLWIEVCAASLIDSNSQEKYLKPFLSAVFKLSPETRAILDLSPFEHASVLGILKPMSRSQDMDLVLSMCLQRIKKIKGARS